MSNTNHLRTNPQRQYTSNRPPLNLGSTQQKFFGYSPMQRQQKQMQNRQNKWSMPAVLTSKPSDPPTQQAKPVRQNYSSQPSTFKQSLPTTKSPMLTTQNSWNLAMTSKAATKNNPLHLKPLQNPFMQERGSQPLAAHQDINKDSPARQSQMSGTAKNFNQGGVRVRQTTQIKAKIQGITEEGLSNKPGEKLVLPLQEPSQGISTGETTKPIKKIIDQYFQQTINKQVEQQNTQQESSPKQAQNINLFDQSTKPIQHLNIERRPTLQKRLSINSQPSDDDMATLKLNKRVERSIVSNETSKFEMNRKEHEKDPLLMNSLSQLVKDMESKVVDNNMTESQHLLSFDETEHIPTLKIIQKISEDLSKESKESTNQSKAPNPIVKQGTSQVIADTTFLHLNGGLVFCKIEGKDVVIHSKIYCHFGKEAIEKVAKNQTVLLGDEKSTSLLNNEQEICKFLNRSSQFKHLENIEILAEGGEAIVYKINYAGYDELVLKIPKQKHQTQGGFEDLICESQLIKCIYHEDYIVEIKEEIIEIDVKTHKMLKYCVVVERARYSLYDLYAFQVKNDELKPKGLWFNNRQSQQFLEKYSLYKFYYYFFQTLKALDYLHSKGIVYADMKPQNLLVMRNQKIKIGDFGVSIVTKENKSHYKFKGLTPSWCIQEIKDLHHEKERIGKFHEFYQEKWPVQTLRYNDLYALSQAFSSQLVKYIEQECATTVKRTEQDQKIMKFFQTLTSNIMQKRSISCAQAIKEVGNFLISDGHMLLTFVQQLKYEKKHEGAYEIGKYLKERFEEFQEIKSENKQMVFIRIYSIMGEFLFYQSEYKKALVELQLVQKYIDQYLPQVKGAGTAYELKQLKIEISLMESKAQFYLGYAELGERKALQAFKWAKEDKKLGEEYQFQIIEMKGQIELNKGNYAAAKPFYLEYAKLLDQKQAESESFQEQREIRSFFNLGQVFCKLGEYDKSLQFYQRAQKILLEHLATSSPVGSRRSSKFNADLQKQAEWNPYMLDCLKQEGNVLVQLEQFEKAQQNFERALKICQAIFGEKNAITAETYMQIAGLFSRKQNIWAKHYYQKALSIFDFLYGQDNFHSADIYNNMASTYESEGDLMMAEKMCQKALDIKLKYQNDKSDSVAQVYMNLGAMKKKQSNYVEACKCYEKSYQIFKQLGLTINRPEMLTTVQNLCKCLMNVSRADDALKILQDTYVETLESSGQYSINALNIMIYLSSTLSQMKRYDEAMMHLKRSLEICEQLPDHLVNKKTKFELLKELAKCSEQQGSPMSEQYYLSALEVSTEPIDNITILKELAFINARVGKFAEAVQHLSRVETEVESLKGKIAKWKQFEEMVVDPLRQFKQECEKHLQENPSNP